MANEDKTPPEETKEDPPPANIIDRKGTWFKSNASFDMEDPTLAQDKGQTKLPKFVAGGYTQAASTRWTESQWRAGVLTKYDGDPQDGGKVVPYVEPTPTPAPVQTSVSTGVSSLSTGVSSLSTGVKK